MVGGTTPACTEVGKLFYSQALQNVVPVTSTQVAEMVKLLENTFRMINIGLVNEIAIMCSRMGINVWEVIEAAATKPFGFMPFYPGPGLGGHCIPIDPFYLSWKSKQAGVEARFIELAGHINGQMPHFVIDKIQNALNDQTKPLRGSHVHILGVAYKRDIDDVRESPALDIIHLLNAAWREGHLFGSFCAVSVDRRPATRSPGWCSRDRRLRGDHHRSCGFRLQGSCPGCGAYRGYTKRAEEHPVRQNRPPVGSQAADG